jgi:predicted ribonuclease YlaK
MKIFADTNILLNSEFNFGNYEKVYISIISIEELDKLKRDERIGYQARQAIKKIEKADNKEIIFRSTYSGVNFLEHNNDNEILKQAYERYKLDNELVFYTDDLCLKVKADSLGLPCERFEFGGKIDLYKGYKEVVLTDEELAQHYESPKNRWNLLINEYLIIKNKDGEVVEKQRWTDKGFQSLSTKTFKSMYLDDFKPKDVYQMCCMDSLINTEFTIITGGAGSGKTMISLSYIMQSIQSGKIGKAIIAFNPAKLRNNESLGFYSGSRLEKMLQNSIGGILSSKFGDMQQVEGLISQGKLMIIPTCDIRGTEISDKDILYVTEAQNIDTYTMRTIIQRAKAGTKIIIEGDILEQQDIKINNIKESGMYKAIEVFKGSPYFSCVKLENIYRSPIAEIAQKI